MYIIGILIILICGGSQLGVLNKLQKLTTENDNLRNSAESMQKKMIAQLRLLNEKKEVEEGDFITIMSKNCWFQCWTGKVKCTHRNTTTGEFLVNFEYCITFYGTIHKNYLVAVRGTEDERIIHFLSFLEQQRLTRYYHKYHPLKYTRQ